MTGELEAWSRAKPDAGQCASERGRERLTLKLKQQSRGAGLVTGGEAQVTAQGALAIVIQYPRSSTCDDAPKPAESAKDLQCFQVLVSVASTIASSPPRVGHMPYFRGCHTSDYGSMSVKSKGRQPESTGLKRSRRTSRNDQSSKLRKGFHDMH